MQWPGCTLGAVGLQSPDPPVAERWPGRQREDSAWTVPRRIQRLATGTRGKQTSGFPDTVALFGNQRLSTGS